MSRPDFSNLEAPETTGERVLRPLKLAWGAIEILGWLVIILYPAYLAGLWLFQSAASGSWSVFLGVAAVAFGALVWLAVSSFSHAACFDLRRFTHCIGCSCAVHFKVVAMRSTPNMALDLAPFGRWTLRDKAAQRRSALR
jgi:hypothetical protein